MKRYRVLSFDFDARIHTLTLAIQEEWEEGIKEQHQQAKHSVEGGLVYAYGVQAKDAKLQNFIELGDKPFSILAFHNPFFEQLRTAFVMGAYYPALTAVCSLGERILNYLVLVLRDDYVATPEYKHVYRKESFDNWDLPIDTLESWEVLLPNVAAEFRRLKEMRNRAIHFRPEVDHNDRELALQAVRSLREIIRTQFSAFGPEPWFITSIPGEIYIKKDWEIRPFIRKVYLPNCRLVGPKHSLEIVAQQFLVKDDEAYADREITDEEFADLRRNPVAG